MYNESNRIAATEESRQVLSVAAVMEQVRLESPRGTVMIRGVVGVLRPFPQGKLTVIYGELEDTDGEYKMSFRCPVGSAPVAVIVLRHME